MARVPVREGLLTTIDPEAEPRLVAARCPRCERLHFPATGDCPYCSSAECVPTPIGPHAVADVVTIVERPPPGYRGRVPYGFGVARLPEGLLLVSRFVAATPDDVREGSPVRLVLEDLFTDETGATLVGFAFAPVTA